MKLFLKNLIIGSVCVAFISCGSSNKEENSEKIITDSAATVVEAIESSERTNFLLPSPLQIASIFKKANLKYMEGLTNPTSNVSKYSSATSKYLNLGVYTSDLSYCTINKQRQPATNYLNACKQLSDELGMSSFIDFPSVAKRFTTNIGNEDSLVSIIADIQLLTDEFLEDNEKKYMSAVIFSGAWVESMYIGAKANEKQQDDKITARISEQVIILKKLIEALKAYESKDASIAPILADFNSINDAIMNLESVKKAGQNNDEEMDLVFTKEEIAIISKKIEDVRTKFING